MNSIRSTVYDGKPRTLYEVTCEVCGVVFWVPKHVLPSRRTCGRVCAAVVHSNSVAVECAFCGNAFKVAKSRLKGSQSGLKRIDNGQILPVVRYRDGKYTYRKRAFIAYGKRCDECGYDLYEEMLDVDHIDNDRSHNGIGNLRVLCVWCHALKTRRVPSHKAHGPMV
jgi:hypothetical protein